MKFVKKVITIVKNTKREIKWVCIIAICCIIGILTLKLYDYVVKIGEIKYIIKECRQRYEREDPLFWDSQTNGFNKKWLHLAYKVNPYYTRIFPTFEQAAIPVLLNEIRTVEPKSSSTEVYLAEIIMDSAIIKMPNNKPSQKVINCIKDLLLSNKFTSYPLIQSTCIKALVIMDTPDLEQFLRGLKNLDKRHILLGLAMLGEETAKKEYFKLILERYNSLIIDKIKQKKMRYIKYDSINEIMNDMVDLGAIAYYTGDRRVLSIYVKIWQDYMELEGPSIMMNLIVAILDYALFPLLDYTRSEVIVRCGTFGYRTRVYTKSKICDRYNEFISWYNKHKNNLFWSKEKQKFVVLEGDDIIKWICEQEIKPPISEEKEQIQKLYQQLASKEPKTREEATQRLIEMGKKVVPGIKEGLNSDDLEVRVRVKHILTEIATRGE